MTELVLSSLAECEVVIEHNLGAVFETGRALKTIRDNPEWYRELGFDGFVEYLESKPWGLGRSTAYQYIDAHCVSAIAETTMPETHARELAPLLKKSTPEVVRQVYAEVLDEAGKPEAVTAAAIREKVREVLPLPEKEPQYGRHLKQVEALIGAVNEFIQKGERLHGDAFLNISTSDAKRYYQRLLKAQEVMNVLVSMANTARKEA